MQSGGTLMSGKGILNISLHLDLDAADHTR